METALLLVELVIDKKGIYDFRKLNNIRIRLKYLQKPNFFLHKYTSNDKDFKNHVSLNLKVNLTQFKEIVSNKVFVIKVNYIENRISADVCNMLEYCPSTHFKVYQSA